LRTRFIWAATALDPGDKPRVSEVVVSEAEEDPDPDPDGRNSGVRSELAAGTVEPWTMANGSLSGKYLIKYTIFEHIYLKIVPRKR